MQDQIRGDYRVPALDPRPSHLWFAPPGLPGAGAGAQGDMGTLRATIKGNLALVVDDSVVERTNLTAILERAGYQVLAAASGQEGIQLAKVKHPGIIFLDIMMSDMDGFKTCRELRSTPETSDIPVVMVSSKKNRADKVWAAEQGAVAYIVKPYKVEDILATLQQFT